MNTEQYTTEQLNDMITACNEVITKHARPMKPLPLS